MPRGRRAGSRDAGRSALRPRAPRRGASCCTGSLLPLSENVSSGPARTRSAHEPVRLPAEQDLARLRRLLEARGDVDRVAGGDRLLRGRVADDDLARVDPDSLLEPHAEPLLELAVQPRQRAPHLVGRPHRAKRVVLVDDRDAEDGHDRVADELLDRAAVPLQHGAHLVEVAEHHAPHRLRVHALAEAREARDVAEQHRDRLADERFGPLGHVSECRPESRKSLGVYTVPLVFDTLSDRLQGALGDLRKRGKLDDEAVSRAMREIRLALLEADVNFQIVKQFVETRPRARGRRGGRRRA